MNILITGAWKQAKEHIHTIEKLGHNVCFMQCESNTLPCTYEWVEGVVGNGLFLKHNIEDFINLKYIQLTSAGFDRVPIDYIQKHDITIYNARGVYSIPMAEYAVAGVLQIYKQMAFFTDNKRKRIWEKNRGLIELNGKKVVIVGCGSVGTECAKRFDAFGCKVVGIDLYPRKDINYESIVDIKEMDDILPQADVVVITLPLTGETRHLFDMNRLTKLNEKSILVNIARGAIIDEDALVDILPHIRGAVLDVFEEEPLPEKSRLWDMDNVIVTPHNSFVGEENDYRLSEVIVENIEEEEKK
ncbi:MAG: D-2-hydroxyacid dehydrogenase [Lachnospiraceae bacterium]|nr:D-2-hydroxyacid dehydrogenase [Lachnospiraceae bacterium]